MSQRNLRISGIEENKKALRDINNTYCNRYSSERAVDSAVRTAEYEHFVQLLSLNATKENLVFSENGALEYASSGSSLVDFNARATEFRNADTEVIIDAAVKAYAEDPVNFVKLMFQTGDIRGGKGERHTFNTCMDWLVAVHPAIAEEVLIFIPEYTRWDYLIRQTISTNKVISRHATEIVKKQLVSDMWNVQKAEYDNYTNISLLAKWMPSLQTKKSEDKKIVRHLLRSLKMQEREYRKTLSTLRGYLNVIEKSLSSKDYDAIDMEKMSAKQQLRYASCLKRVMTKQRHEYIQAVLRGEKKMNTSILNPLEILHEYVKGGYRNVTYNEDIEALWSLIPDKTSGNCNTLVIRDGSASMMEAIGQGSSATMLEAATAMAVYCADHMTGPFKDKFITFSSRPALISLSDCHTFADKIKLLFEYGDCSNTDIEATFDLILEIAVKNGLSQDEIPSYLMILSDMEFDIARGAYGYYNWNTGRKQPALDRDTLFTTIRKKWNAAGYDMPTLVFWQLNGARTIYPEIDAKNGIIFLSGFSTNELELVMAGKYETVKEVTEEVKITDEESGEITTLVKTREERKVLSPKEQLELKLSDPRYDEIEAAVRTGLRREIA